MSRIQKAFERLNGEGRKALIPFITAGDPSADLTVPLMHALVEAGALALEQVGEGRVVAVGVVQQRAGLADVAMVEHADFGITVGHRADLGGYWFGGSKAKVAPQPTPCQTLAVAGALG